MDGVAPPWLPPPDVTRVLVQCTARTRGGDVRRLPDRHDAHGVLGAVLVETEDQARAVLAALDVPGRTIVVDVERKQDLALDTMAGALVRHARWVPTKPNDTTIRSLDVVLTDLFGPDLSSLRALVVGPGNIGFKSALLLAERNVAVAVHGRDATRTRLVVDALRTILPAHARRAPVVDDGVSPCDLLLGAAAADGVLDRSWLARVERGGVVLDAGIGNVTADLVAAAPAAGVGVVRLDARAAEAQVLWPAQGFGVGGGARRGVVDGVPVACCGLVAERGVVVVDDCDAPGRVIGVADGVGGLLPVVRQSPDERERSDRVEQALSPR